MKIAFKSLIAAAAFIVAGTASAATVTVTIGGTTYKGVKLSGGETLTLSPEATGTLDVLTANVTGSGAGVATVAKDSDGFFTGVSLTTPLSTLTVDDITDQALSVASTGGLTVTAPARKAVSTGGSLTVTDLNIDLSAKRIYATVIGANGVGTLTNVYLWDITTVTGSTLVTSPNGPSLNAFTASGLRLTTDGINKMASALGLLNLGKSALQGATDFGTIAVTLNSALRPLTPCAVTFKTVNKTSPLPTTEVTLHNFDSNAATGWKVNWTYGKPTLLLSVNNAKITDKSLQRYTAQPLKADAVIPAGGSTRFGFRSYANGGVPAASNLSATLGGQTCPVTVQ